MEQLIELYEMVAVNDSVLHGTEKLAILKARLALRMFERAMQGFKAEMSHARCKPGSLRIVRDCEESVVPAAA